MSPVTVTVEAGIAWVAIDNPPVNALSRAVREGLIAAIEQVDSDAAVRAAILVGEGRTFIAGADITEFDKPPTEPILPDIVKRLERSGKPWIAAIHGAALGGGLEVALGCHYRTAAASARLGCPEVQLGLIPGAGGTVRLPRLIAPKHAVGLVSGGKPVSAAQAADWGLVDQVVDGDLRAAALKFAREVAGRPLPQPLAERAPTGRLEPAEWDSILADARQKARGQIAPVVAVEAARDATELPADQALVLERKRFLELREGEQSKALRYIFLAEKSVPKVPDIRGVTPRPADHVGVIGGGTMGAGIAAAVLLAGCTVTMIERDFAALERGLGTTRSHLDNSLKRGLVDAARHQAMMSRLSGSTDYGSLGTADLVIEAVFEDMDAKIAVFARLDQVTRPNAVLATNTSYLDVKRIAQAVRDPSRVIGLHFFSPAHVMKLLEVIRTGIVAPDALATGFAFAGRLGKIPVPAGVCHGFIGNRIMSAYRRECEYMIEDGALPQEVDAAMTGFGFPMGVFAMQDLSGLDISWAMRKSQAATRDPNLRYVAIADRLCELGRFGRKTGAGYFQYAASGTGGDPDPLVERIILEESARKGIIRRPIQEAEITGRILRIMQAEGERILSEGIAASPEAIDVVMVNGFGFPRWRGGPMFMRR
ncbi:MAG TPA: 3-hydroxyacyl-CoA dehydrogenase NAD-binding domain-containing protein [Dongiaceae bacterium]|jgi:3-hydroxyacyl-CoA dehydrogenase|nr:3-hydroxyacyl-CoA dehydrogenase NAD-binding domain-containing protein [Dongiaceae bacterium]